MKIAKKFCLFGLLALLWTPLSVFSQDEAVPERGFVEMGFRGITGTVDGRTGLGQVPFSNGFRPNTVNSGINTYRDYRNGFYIPRSDLFMDGIFGTKNYFSLQSANNGVSFTGANLIRDHTILATLGQQGRYKLQFRWDQTPHIFSGTTRTLFQETSPGVWQFTGSRAVLDSARQTATAAAFTTALNSQIANAVESVQRNIRKNFSSLASWDINPDWNTSVSFTRETQDGTRPHGMCFGNSPSCVWAEVPEKLDYATNTVKGTTAFGKENWNLFFGYSGQAFENKVSSMLVDNPFSNNVYSASVTANGQLGLYPNNHSQDLQFGGAAHFGPAHFMSSITPGWQSQNDPFMPYTTNTFLLSRTGSAAPIPLPVSSLNGQKQTLAMNYTFVVNPSKRLELAAKYRQYDHHNNTEEHQFNPYVNDLAAEVQLAGPSGQETIGFAGINGFVDPDCHGVCNEPFSFGTKDIELSGTWFFTKKSSTKLQYLHQSFDRHHRDVSQTLEDTLKLTADVKPIADLTFRVAGAYQNREPQDRHYEWALIPGTQRPDEGFRTRKRVDALAQYDVSDRFSVSSFFGTTQDDFNRRDPLTSLSPLGDPSLITTTTRQPTPIYGPYYVFGLLDDFAWNAGGDFDVLLGSNVTFFGEYSRERNTNRMVQRQRGANTASQVGCPPPPGSPAGRVQDCDPINDWMTASKDIVDSYFAGTDLNIRKNAHISLSYGLAATKSTTMSEGVNCQIGIGPNAYCRTNFPNWVLDNATNPAATFNFPENVTRFHEVAAIVKFNLTPNLMPKLEYRYQRSDYKDFQTSVMNPFAFVGPAIDPNGTTGLQRMLFLGADTPGYRTHVFTVTLEYHF